MGDSASFPTGTVTFLFTDIEGSTRLWEQNPDAMRLALARHHALIITAIEQRDGVVVKSQGEGDSFFAVFPRASDAVASACALQHALGSEPWPTAAPLRVRMALHTGEADLREGDYYGAAVNRCARLRAAAHGGQVLLSGATAELVQDELPASSSLRDLGLHRLRDLHRPEHVFQLLHPDLPADFPHLLSLDALPNNLPQEVTSFVGREREIAEVKRLLERTRLLTVTGAGGTGKTRLALQAAADLLPEQPDGVWLVELAPLSEPGLVPQTVSAVLGVREEAGTPLTQALVNALKPRRMLLVLDNCEHLLAACATLADALLRGCPGVRLLATSREGLNIPGETPYRLRSLTCPDPQQPLPTLESLSEYEAVQLFVDRATTATASFRLTEPNAPAVTQICAWLDGIPLAIELAAARVRVMSVEQLATRLDDRFRLLTGGSRTALPRQQTLRALIDWSYDLLSEPEQTLLQRLSVFAAGWTLEAAEPVCAGERIESWEVLDLLTGLVDKSLVVVDEQGDEARYRLLETVRQYARDRLLEAGEIVVARQRHRDWVLALVERAEPELEGEHAAAWRARLEREEDNVRAALEWTVESGEVEAGLRIGGALEQFWAPRGSYTEGRERLSALLGLPGASQPSPARAKALLTLGWLSTHFGTEAALQAFRESLAICRELEDRLGTARALRPLGSNTLYLGPDHSETGRALLEESLMLFRELGHQRGVADALRALAVLATWQGDYEAAQSSFDESLSLLRALNARRSLGFALNELAGLFVAQSKHEAARKVFQESLAILREMQNKIGILHVLVQLVTVAHNQGDDEAARAFVEEGLATARAMNDPSERASNLYRFGAMARCLEDYERAASCLDESLGLSRKLGSTELTAAVLRNRGHVALHQGDPRLAAAHFAESLGLFQQQGNRRGIAAVLAGCAGVAGAAGHPERAAMLFGAAKGLLQALDEKLQPVDQADFDRSIAAIRVEIEEQVFAASWEAGRTMSLEAAIHHALQETADA